MIIFNSFGFLSYAIAAVALLATGAIMLRGLKPLGGTPKVRLVVLGLTGLTSCLLALAAFNPLWVEKKTAPGYHLQVAVDVSDSVLRGRGGWEQLQKDLADRIGPSVDAVNPVLRRTSTAGILTFRTHTHENWSKGSLAQLVRAFRQIEPGSFAAGDGTDLEEVLVKSQALVDHSGGVGAVLLISDGNQTSGDVLPAARDLARQGIPVHVFPVAGSGPAVAITDADLPRSTHVHIQTYIRGLLLNNLSAPIWADLELKAPQTTLKQKPQPSQRVSLPSGQWVQFRWPAVFSEFGLHFVDLALNPEGGKISHNRRFYTYVKRPPRILAIGGDNKWTAAIPGGTAEIISVEASTNLSTADLKDIDAVVINSVPASRFSKNFIAGAAGAVEKKGLGLMLINGKHEGADLEAETVLMSYKKTPLDRVLPVTAGPRPFKDEPPPRNIAILMDTSGSMEGWKLDKSRQVARYIVTELMRPQDRLDLITFTSGVGSLLENCPMNTEGKTKALQLIDSVKAWGGTDPRRALGHIGNRQLAECGLIFISDGEFDYVDYRPDCRVTVFEIGSDRFSKSKSLQQLADPVPVSRDFDPKAIKIPYFQPPKRTQLFEPGTFIPLSMANLLPLNQRLPVPALNLEGAAVCHLKEGALLNAVRPKLTDPVLVYREAQDAAAGVFTSAFPPQWIEKEEGKRAVEAWISRIIPFIDRNRYDFKIDDRGDTLDIRVSLIPNAGKIPAVQRMSASIDIPGEESIGIILNPDESAPGTFSGQAPVERKELARQGSLNIREFGPEALPRTQRIPIDIPPSGSIQSSQTDEASTFGTNYPLLRQIAEITGGKYDPPRGTPFFKEKHQPQQSIPLWQYLATIAVFSYLAAVAVKRWNT